jgi:transcriptional regulator with XRE-family HTH domain
MQKSDKPALRIRAIREAKGYTQEYMAEMMGICQSTYAHLESGKTKLHVDRLVKIADLLEVDVTALIEITSLHNRNIKNECWTGQASSIELEPSAKKVYDTLVEELRAEIQFLRSLVQPLKS